MIYLDSESYSELDVREVGAYRYWEHPSTHILVLCWAENDGPVQTWTWLDGTGLPMFTNEVIVAHNVEFERCALTRERLAFGCTWVDTAAQAAMCALPRGLGKAADALGLPVQKNKRGSYLIGKLSKPQRPSKTNPHTEPHLRWPDYRLLLNEFADYCATDVEVCRALHRTLPELPPLEAEIFDMTLRINERGIAVDLAAVRAAMAFVERAVGFRGNIVRALTGFSHTQVGELLNWVNDKLCRDGLPQLESFDKAAISAALRRKHLPPAVREVLEIRRDLAKSSTAKLESMLNRANEDGRVRGSLLYHGAGTGRWSGAGIQPQNFPVANGLVMDDAAHAILAGDEEWVRMVWDMEPPAFVSRALRGMLIAAPGHTLIGADFKSIEARVVLWLAKDPGLALFAGGTDIYVEMAKAIDRITPNRQLGKQAVLGCGFGMGPLKFLDTCAKYGIEADASLAERAVRAYRGKFHKVPRLWTAMNDAAVAAVKNPGVAYRTNPEVFQSITFVCDDRFLKMKLPSGRFVHYPYPRIEAGKFGGDAVSFMGVDALTKQWRRESCYGGKWVQGATQAVARDIMARALLRLEAHGYSVVGTVHDEAICEVPIVGGPTVAYIEELMCELPGWAVGLPVEAEGFSGSRYS
jgi:DNA polymerase